MFTAVHRWMPLIVILCACSERVPPPPASLTAALSSAEKAVAEQRAIPANTVSKELQAFAGRPAVPEAMRGRLNKLAREVEAINGLMPVQSVPYWQALAPRIQLAIHNKDPGPGPRFRPDLPPGVTEAIGEAENALRDFNVDGACAAVDHTTMELSSFSWQVPKPRDFDRLRHAVELLDAMPETCRQSAPSDIRAKYDAALADLSP